MGIYGSFVYGSTAYGVTLLPVSATFNIFDFCEPTDTMMTALFAFSETTPSRTYGAPYYSYNGANDLCLYSDDSVDSGFRIDTSITDGFTLQFTILPTDLPNDFSDTVNRRFFVAAYNQFGKMAGLLLSEHGGVALAQVGDGSFTRILDTDDLFTEGTDYYTFRVTVNGSTGRSNLYITRTDLLAVTGHRLICTFDAYDTPSGLTDHLLVEVVGDGTYPTTVCIDCLRMANSELIPNERPIAIPGDDQVVNLNSYAGFDGRSSYDPDSYPGNPLKYWWTCIGAPGSSALLWSTGTANTPADLSEYTNVVNGGAGTFSSVRRGDLLFVGEGSSPIMYINSDGSQAVAMDRVFPASQTSITWSVIKQASWGGTWVDSTNMTDVLSVVSSLPGSPSTGDVYLLDSGPNVDQIATWGGASWSYSIPSIDDLVYVIDSFLTQRYIGSAYPAGQWEALDPLPWELGYWTGRTLNIGSFLPDTSGQHTITLMVNDGDLNSIPTEVILSVQETRMPFGIVPDLSWIWDLISDFWNVVEDKGKIETIWSGFTQVAAGLLMELWQNDYAKSLLDIQRVFQKKWISYHTLYEEPNYSSIPATINNPMSFGGYSAAPGSNSYFYETGIDLTGFTTANAFVLDGEVFKIARFVEDPIAAPGYPTGVALVDPLPSTGAHSSHWQIRPTVVSRSSNFTDVAIREGDTAIFEVVDTTDSTSIDVSTHVYGARQSILCFDDAPISAYLANSRYTVRFKSVQRRNRLNLSDSIVGIPILQEVINQDLETADTPLVQNNSYFVETLSTITGTELNVVRFADSWYEELALGVDGATSVATSLTFTSAGTDFHDLIGPDGTDAKDYFILIDDKKHRLYSTDTLSTDVQFEDVSLADSLTGLRWKLLRLVTPPEYLWAELTYVDNEPTIQANFGRLVGLDRETLAGSTSDIDYLSAVRGLWYTYWFGPTPFNIRVGAQILLGLPFAEKAGTITDITSPFDDTRSRILIRDSNNTTIIRTYYYPTILGIAINPETDVAYEVGDTVEQFAPLSRGITVTDWVEDEDWYATYIGSGDFPEPWKVHRFGITVDSAAFNLQNLQFVISYVQRIKPHYTYPWFVVTQSLESTIDVDDSMVQGPVIPDQTWPATGKYPDDWPAAIIPLGWNTTPWFVPRSTDPVLVHDSYGNQLATSFIPKSYAIQTFGGLHLDDAPARVPDGWTGTLLDGSSHSPTRAEGTFCLDATDQSGNPIHRLDDMAIFPTDQEFSDPDMETVGVTSWPAVGSPATRVKDGTIYYAGSQSLKIQDSSSDVGAYQDFPAVDIEGFQFAVTGYVRVDAGQCHLVLYDQDGTVAAEKRIGYTGTQWVEFTLHAWEASSYLGPVSFAALTGPVGGTFYLDNVGGWMKQMPWVQWGLDRMYTGRTGGYTVGGSPDERVLFQMHTVFP